VRSGGEFVGWLEKPTARGSDAGFDVAVTDNLRAFKAISTSKPI